GVQLLHLADLECTQANAAIIACLVSQIQIRELACVAVRVWIHQHRIHHAENSRRGTDSHSDRNDGSDRESWIPAQLPECENRVLEVRMHAQVRPLDGESGIPLAGFSVKL